MPATLDPALPDDVLDGGEEVLALAHGQDLKLATAESCTGGSLAALLTDVPGRSHEREKHFGLIGRQSGPVSAPNTGLSEFGEALQP